MNQNYLIIITALIIIGSQWILSPHNAQEELIVELKSQSELQNKLQNKLIDALKEIKHLLQETNNQQYTSVDSYDGSIVRLDTTGLENTIREIMREEIKQITPNNSVRAMVKKSNNTSAFDSEMAFSESNELISRAISNGGWNSSFSSELASHRSKLSTTQRKHLMDQYIQSVHNGDIDIRGTLPPF